MASLRRRLPAFADRLALGSSGLRVSPFCVGIVRTPRAIEAAFDAGINFFFLTADMHWPMYEATRRGLNAILAARPSARDRIVVAAACYPTQPEFSHAPFTEVLEAVPRLERIDVAVIGGAYGPDFRARLPIYREHRQRRFAGIRAAGASFHDRRTARAAIDDALIDVAFVRYNAAHPGAAADLFPRLRRRRRRRVPIFNFTTTNGFVSHRRMRELGLGRDYWRPDITDHYRFALTRPEISGLRCSPATPAEVAAIARAIERGPLTDEEQRYLAELSLLDQGRARLA
jgi:aryl-alcohol dehydrogenase-like predicted oxidoreductase